MSWVEQSNGSYSALAVWWLYKQQLGYLFLILYSFLCSSHYQEKSALTHVYPLTLDGLVAFSENTLLSNAQCDTGPQLHGE